MNVYKTILVCSILAILAIACNSTSQKMRDDLNKADSSIQSSNTMELDSLTLLCVSILAMQQINPQLAKNTDSLYLFTKSTTDFIDSLKTVLSEKDATGNDTLIATQVMAYDNSGALLYQQLLNIYTCSIKSLVTKTKSTGVDSIFSTLRGIPSATVFVQQYFKGASTKGAGIILTSFKNECVNSALLVLEDIKNRVTTK